VLSTLNYLCLGPILNFNYVTTEVLKLIAARMRCLRGLRIQQCFSVDEVIDISPVTEIKTLEALKLHGIKRTWTHWVDWSPLKKLRKLYLDLWWWGSNSFTHRGVGRFTHLKQLCLWDSKSYNIVDVCQLKELNVLFLCHPTVEMLELLAHNLKQLKTFTFSVEAASHIECTQLVCRIFRQAVTLQVLFPVDMETVCTRRPDGVFETDTRHRSWPKHKLTSFQEFDNPE